jgi:hypothetical protein
VLVEGMLVEGMLVEGMLVEAVAQASSVARIAMRSGVADCTDPRIALRSGLRGYFGC